MRARGTALIALVLLAAATTAAHAIASVTVFGLRAPDEVGGFRLNDSMNFERSKPGEGYSLDYSQPGWKLDVFIYDLKRSAIPDDAKSAMCGPSSSARARTCSWRSRGACTLRSTCGAISPSRTAKRTRFQCAAFHVTRGAKPQDGFLCVTSWNNKFINFRMTTLSNPNTEAAARQHMAAWVPVLWNPNAKPVAEPRKPEARAQQRRRPPPRVRRPAPCPPGYICR